MTCTTDDGRELTVPVLLDGEETIMEFIDLPYSGVCISLSFFSIVNDNLLFEKSCVFKD